MRSLILLIAFWFLSCNPNSGDTSVNLGSLDDSVKKSIITQIKKGGTRWKKFKPEDKISMSMNEFRDTDFGDLRMNHHYDENTHVSSIALYSWDLIPAVGVITISGEKEVIYEYRNAHIAKLKNRLAEEKKVIMKKRMENPENYIKRSNNSSDALQQKLLHLEDEVFASATFSNGSGSRVKVYQVYGHRDGASYVVVDFEFDGWDKGFRIMRGETLNSIEEYLNSKGYW